MQVANLFKQGLNRVRREVKLHPRVYLVFQILFLGWSIYWWRFPPDPGKAVLLLGVVAAIVTIQPQMTDSHRLVWLVIVFVLFFVEFRAINRDRAEAIARERAARAEENAKFSAVLEDGRKHFETTLAENRTEFSETLRRSDQIIGGIADSIKMQTGADSFCYIDFDRALKDMGRMTVVRVGKYPLRGVTVQIVDRAKMQLAVEDFMRSHQANRGDPALVDEVFAIQRASMATWPITDFATPTRFFGGYQLTKSSRGQSFDMVFFAYNGSWIERLEIREVNGKWTKAILVEHGTKHFVKVDQGYPRKDGRLDVPWPRPVKGRADWDQ